jgi:TetR/AcrR family transcriptional regulator, ethionamide resistance regulator
VSTSTQRSRRREQREETRRRITAAADALLREHPYRELSVEVVMTRTGLSRTAFYRHFDDIPDIVLRLLEDVGGELYAIARRWSESAGHDYPNAAHEGLAGIVDFFVRHGRLVRAVADAAATDEQIERGYTAFMNAFTEMIAATLERLVASDRLELPDTRAMAAALNLMNEAFLLDQFGREPIGDRDVALATLETIWLRVLGLR